MTSTLKTDKIEGVTASGTVQMPAGHVVQVVSGTTNTERQITSTSFVTTSLTATITPKFSTSKILVMVNIGLYHASGGIQNAAGELAIYRGSSAISTKAHRLYDYGSSGLLLNTPENLMTIDSPSTTSATVYTVFAKVASGGPTIYIDVDGKDSIIVLQEIAQ